MQRGLYYVIEGQDSTGKSTQAEMLADFFRKQGRKVVTIHEPDGDLASAHILRELVLNKDYNLEPETYVLLYTAARKELWTKLASPVLDQDGVVIASRNWWSTIAYQGAGQGASIESIERITLDILPPRYYYPDNPVILTIDETARLARLHARDDTHTKDTFESKPPSFQESVSKAYLAIAKNYFVPIMDASADAQTVHEQILSLFRL